MKPLTLQLMSIALALSTACTFGSEDPKYAEPKDARALNAVLHVAIQTNMCNESVYGLLNMAKSAPNTQEILDLQDHKGNTALHHAVIAHNHYALEQLINAGASLDIGDKFNFTPLIASIVYGNLPALRFLIAKGASIHVTALVDDTVMSPLLLAATVNNSVMVKELLQQNPSREQIQEALQTIERTLSKSFLYERSRKAFPKLPAKTADQVTADHKIIVADLHTALKKAKPTSLACSSPSAPTPSPAQQAPASDVSMPLIQAVLSNDKKQLMQHIALIAIKAKKDKEKIKELLDQKDANGLRAIDHAVQHNNLEAVKQLIKAGATIDQTALDYAQQQCEHFGQQAAEHENTKPTIQTKAQTCALQDREQMLDIIKDGTQLTENCILNVLIATAHSGDTEFLSVLFDDNHRNSTIKFIDCQDKGKNALAYAAIHNQLEAVRLLLAHGASIDAQDSQGFTALMHAINNDRFEMVKLLFAHAQKPNMHTTDILNQTPLMVASLSVSPAIVLFLLEHGADVQMEDNVETPRTALSLAQLASATDALQKKYPECSQEELDKANALIIQLLKAYEIKKVLQYAHAGKTPLMIAASKPYYHQLFKKEYFALLKESPDKNTLQSILNQQDKEGLTALAHAIATNNQFALEQLILAGADVNLGTYNNIPPVVLALQYNNLPALIGLVDLGKAKTNIIVTNDTSLLMYSISINNPLIVEFILMQNPTEQDIKNAFDMADKPHMPYLIAKHPHKQLEDIKRDNDYIKEMLAQKLPVPSTAQTHDPEYESNSSASDSDESEDGSDNESQLSNPATPGQATPTQDKAFKKRLKNAKRKQKQKSSHKPIHYPPSKPQKTEEQKEAAKKELEAKKQAKNLEGAIGTTAEEYNRILDLKLDHSQMLVLLSTLAASWQNFCQNELPKHPTSEETSYAQEMLTDLNNDIASLQRIATASNEHAQLMAIQDKAQALPALTKLSRTMIRFCREELHDTSKEVDILAQQVRNKILADRIALQKALKTA